MALNFILKLLLLLSSMGASMARITIPFISKKEYTPLVFFTVPKDLIPENDEMEKVVRQVEKELGVRVERLDVLKNKAAGATLSLLSQRNPPLLYNRESCQTVFVPGVSDAGKRASFPVDKQRVRAWAKGRFLPAQKALEANAKAPVVLSQKGKSIDQKDLIEDATLTPEQKAGKDAMKKRTEELGEKKKNLK